MTKISELICFILLGSRGRGIAVGNIDGPWVLAANDHQCKAVDVDPEQAAKARLYGFAGGSLFAALDAQTAAVAAKLVLERDNRFRLLLDLMMTLAGALTRLIPPPLIDLLLAHIEVILMFGSQTLDAVTGPHRALPEFGPKQEKLTLGFALALAVFVDFRELQARSFVGFSVTIIALYRLLHDKSPYIHELFRRGRARVLAQSIIDLRQSKVLNRCFWLSFEQYGCERFLRNWPYNLCRFSQRRRRLKSSERNARVWGFHLSL